MVETVTVFTGSCRMLINLEPFFERCTIPQAKKLFGYVFEEPWRNEETISALHEFLLKAVENAKDQWIQASITYQNEYVDTAYRYVLSEKEIRRINAVNKRRYQEIKRCKEKYLRRVIIKTHFENIKNKNSTRI